MQGTVLVLMVLSGVGCHHKACSGYAPLMTGCYAGYESACYASYEPACYAEPIVLDGCYGGCYGDACYSGGYGPASLSACYGGFRAHRHRGLFGCFKRKHCGLCNGGYAYDGCYGSPVFGAYPPVTYGYGPTLYGSSQMYGSGQGSYTGTTWGAAPMTTTTDVLSTPDSVSAPETAAPADSSTITPPVPEATTPPPPAEPAPSNPIPDAPGAAADAVRDVIPAAPAPEATPTAPPSPGGF